MKNIVIIVFGGGFKDEGIDLRVEYCLSLCFVSSCIRHERAVAIIRDHFGVGPECSLHCSVYKSISEDAQQVVAATIRYQTTNHTKRYGLGRRWQQINHIKTGIKIY